MEQVEFKIIMVRTDFSGQFRKVIIRNVVTNELAITNVIRKSVCLAFNPILVNTYDSLFNCIPVAGCQTVDFGLEFLHLLLGPPRFNW